MIYCCFFFQTKYPTTATTTIISATIQPVYGFLGCVGITGASAFFSSAAGAGGSSFTSGVLAASSAFLASSTAFTASTFVLPTIANVLNPGDVASNVSTPSVAPNDFVGKSDHFTPSNLSNTTSAT